MATHPTPWLPVGVRRVSYPNQSAADLGGDHFAGGGNVNVPTLAFADRDPGPSRAPLSLPLVTLPALTLPSLTDFTLKMSTVGKVSCPSCCRRHRALSRANRPPPRAQVITCKAAVAWAAGQPLKVETITVDVSLTPLALPVTSI